MSRRTFHHGNLRAALLELAAQELALHGYEALSLRDLAESLGVSAAAPYRHFENKNALLVALAEAGVEELRLIYLRALTLEANPGERLRYACQAYLDYARDNPEFFRLIFVSNADWHSGPTDRFDRRDTAYGIFEQLVADNQLVQTKEAAVVASLTAWSTIHGFAVLQMNGRLDGLSDSSLIEATREAVIARACSRQNGR